MQRKKEYLNTKEAAALLGVSDSWVVRLIKNKELEAFRLSERAWAVKRSSALKKLGEYMSENKRGRGHPRKGSA